MTQAPAIFTPSLLRLLAVLAAAAPVAWCPAPIRAEKGGMYGPAPTDRKTVAPPPAYTREIGIDQKLNNQVPLDAQFVNDSGVTVSLSTYLDGRRPVILAPVYYECPSVCTLVLNGVAKAAKVLSLETGKDYQVIALSIAPQETTAIASKKKLAYMNELKSPRAPESWHFLTGDEAQIRRVTEAVGFRYFWDEKTQTYAHAAGIMLLTPEGRVSRYLFGTDYTPLDLRLGLTEAGGGRIGGITEQVLLLCFQYDAGMGRYSAAVLNLVRMAGILTLLLVGGFIFYSVRREKSTLGSGASATRVARSSLISPSEPASVPPVKVDEPGSEKVS